jgi:hypothetical protein
MVVTACLPDAGFLGVRRDAGGACNCQWGYPQGARVCSAKDHWGGSGANASGGAGDRGNDTGMNGQTSVTCHFEGWSNVSNMSTLCINYVVAAADTPCL